MDPSLHTEIKEAVLDGTRIALESHRAKAEPHLEANIDMIARLLNSHGHKLDAQTTAIRGCQILLAAICFILGIIAYRM